MPIADLSSFRARLSYNAIQEYTGWQSNVMVNDYLGITASNSAIITQVNTNEAGITSNKANIEINADNIQINADNIQINADVITFNFQYLHGDPAYPVDYDDTATTYAIGDSVTFDGNEYGANVAIVAPAGVFDPLMWDRVATVDNYGRIKTHEAATVAHGSTGGIVGNLDFCTDLVGGVVLLMDLVADAVDSTATVVLADIGAAPGVYSQLYSDSQTDLINDLKAKHNTLLDDLNLAILQLNTLIDNSKTAKQMDV